MSSFISSLLLLLLLLLCHVMHGCDGRRLGVGKESHKHVHHSSKDHVEKISKVKTSLLKELRMRKHQKATSSNTEKVIINDHQSDDGARTQKQIKHPEPSLLNKEVEETKQTIPGSTTEISMFSDEGLQQSTKIEGSERRGRSVLGSQSHVTDETIDHSKENGDIGVVEDVVVMDYEQPHKKPPIHNFSP